jgi:hypothetical protein
MTPKLASVLLAGVAISVCAAACGATGGSATIEGPTTPRSSNTEGGSGSAAVASPAAPDPPVPGFEDTSGRTHIPAFGVEASADERSAVEAVLSAYLRASREGEWGKACTYLLGDISSEISVLERGSNPSGGEGCATALPRVFDLSRRNGLNPYLGPAPLSGLRVKEGTGAGFALFHGVDGNDYWVAMKVEGGRWRVLSTIPQPL